MPLDITFTLSDDDLSHFQRVVDRAKSALGQSQSAGQIEAAAKKLIEDSRASDLPDFISSRLSKLEVVINMVGDAEWGMSEEERHRVLGALVYFCDPDDLIPDHLPGIGFLDDAIYVELIIRDLKAEIESYQEFCNFRSAEEKRRKDQGLDPYVEREEWLADKRASLQAWMRKRRRAGGIDAVGWRFRW